MQSASPSQATVNFVIPTLQGAGVIDLENALVALSGVARIDVDETSHTVSVQYDPAFVNEELIGSLIKNAGYGVASAGGSGIAHEARG